MKFDYEKVPNLRFQTLYPSFFGTIISICLAVGKTNIVQVFIGIEAIFLVMTFAAWAYTEVRFEGDSIIRTVFFLFSSKRPISSIKHARFGADTDNFGGRTTYTAIEFNSAKPFILFDFSKTDLREIVQRISAKVPNAIDPNLRAHLDSGEANKNWRDALHPGDKFIFAALVIFVLLALVWWLLQRF